MALNKTLNATCDLDGYLFCRMPEDTLEVEVKNQNKIGKVHHVPGHLHLDREVLLLGTGQIGEVVCKLEGGGHPEGK